MAKDRRDKFLSVPPYVCLENVFPRLNDIYFRNVIRIGMHVTQNFDQMMSLS